GKATHLDTVGRRCGKKPTVWTPRCAARRQLSELARQRLFRLPVPDGYVLLVGDCQQVLTARMKGQMAQARAMRQSADRRRCNSLPGAHADEIVMLPLAVVLPRACGVGEPQH